MPLSAPQQPQLFSYVLRVDDGAAPNPFWGICTLAICKPRIRSVARVGDWVVGTGSKNAPQGDLRKHLVYVMRVTRKLSMREYDEFSARELVAKRPEWRSRDWRRRLGDSIYDFNHEPSRIRRSVHNEGNRERDLGGQYVLLSEDFLYFGDQPIRLPDYLLGIVQAGQGHRSVANAPFLGPFVMWVRSLDREWNTTLGLPQVKFWPALMDATDEAAASSCSLGTASPSNRTRKPTACGSSAPPPPRDGRREC